MKKEGLEAEVSEGTVCLGHFVDIITLPDRVAGIVGSILDLVSKSDVHWSPLLAASESNNPTHSKGLGAVTVHFQGHLVSGSTDATRLHLHTRLSVLDSAVDDLERVDGVRAFVGAVDSGIDDTLSEGALTISHYL